MADFKLYGYLCRNNAHDRPDPTITCRQCNIAYCYDCYCSWGYCLYCQCSRCGEKRVEFNEYSTGQLYTCVECKTESLCAFCMHGKDFPPSYNYSPEEDINSTKRCEFCHLEGPKFRRIKCENCGIHPRVNDCFKETLREFGLQEKHWKQKNLHLSVSSQRKQKNGKQPWYVCKALKDWRWKRIFNNGVEKWLCPNHRTNELEIVLR